jgi:hypothetical protein
MHTRFYPVLIWLLAGSQALAQGTLYFSSFVPDKGVLARVDAAYPVIGSYDWIGPEWRGQLRVEYQIDSGRPLGPVVVFGQGVPRGYFDGGVITVPGAAPGSILEGRVAVWLASSGDTFETATVIGVSPPFGVVLGGGGDPPGPPGYLVGLRGFSIPVPEPSASVLSVLGTAVLATRYWFLRRADCE